MKSMLDRCQAAGYETLVVTVDVPVEPRREHDLRNGLSVPPRFDLKTVWQMVTHPPWALRMLLAGVPQLVTLEPYARSGKSFCVLRSIRDSVEFNAQHLGGRITAERFEKIRAAWSGQVVVKGILDPEDARGYLALGADGLIVSNHGGRQLDAAPSAVTALPRIRKAVGPDVTLICRWRRAFGPRYRPNALDQRRLRSARAGLPLCRSRARPPRGRSRDARSQDRAAHGHGTARVPNGERTPRVSVLDGQRSHRLRSDRSCPFDKAFPSELLLPSAFREGIRNQRRVLPEPSRNDHELLAVRRQVGHRCSGRRAR